MRLDDLEKYMLVATTRIIAAAMGGNGDDTRSELMGQGQQEVIDGTHSAALCSAERR